VVNKKLANLATEWALVNAECANEFLTCINLCRRTNKRKLLVALNRRQVDRKLFIALSRERDTEARIILNEYWEDLIEENENLRYSIKSKEAFRFLSKVYKYNQFERRDGAMASVVKVGDAVIRNEDEVNRLIMDSLKKVQVDERSSMYSGPLPFPYLPDLNPEELECVFRKLWPGKAITTDCIGDNIFGKECRERVIRVLRDLWSGINLRNFHFLTRLIPLNKKFPDIPTPDQIRPIIVSSPLVKILESRLRSKLQKFLRDHVHRSQVGFTEGMDIYVNIWRALRRILELNCLFLDFKSAYNTVLHNLLYEKLERVLDEGEIALLKAIFSRLRITLGKEHFQPNIGVPQGSVISPSLFNIYAASLLEGLEQDGMGSR